MDSPKTRPPTEQRSLDPFRRAVLRGLGILLPPLLTIVIFVWIGNTVAVYLLEPLERGARSVLYYHFEQKILPASTEVTTEVPAAPEPSTDGADAGAADSADASPTAATRTGSGPIYGYEGQYYRRAGDLRYVPADDYEAAERMLGGEPLPNSAAEIYHIYVDTKFLQRKYVVPVFLCLFLLFLYLLGKFLAAGVGRFFWMQVERFINRLPLVRNVYSSVKQVTDFLFSEREIEYTRVVAVEYPRKGVWTLAMVTGESLLDITAAANEPVVSVLIPTSPMPFTGFTVTVRRSETIDLNITIDQAFQFIVSCGVVVPPHQISSLSSEREHSSATFPPTSSGK